MSAKSMPFGIKILVAICVVIALSGGGVICAYEYLEANDLFPDTIQSVIAGEITDKDGNSFPFIEMNYYADKDNKGVELMELAFNFYTNYDKSEVRSYVMQRTIKPPPANAGLPLAAVLQKSTPVFERYQNGSWGAMTKLEYGDNAYPMVFDIDGQTYAFYLDGEYTKKVYNYPNEWERYWAESNTVFSNKEKFAEIKTYKYTYVDFFDKAFEMLTKTSFGEGDYTLPIVNLAEYFSIGKFNEETLQFDPLPYTSHEYTAFKINGHYSKNTVRYARQSLIGQINGQSDWTLSGEGLQDYWQHRFEKNLSLNDFEMRHSEADGGYWLTLPKELIGEINRAGDFLVNIVLDLGKSDKKILGFDFYAVEGLAVKKLTVSAVLSQDFTLKNSWNANSTVKTTEFIGVTAIYGGENNG